MLLRQFAYPCMLLTASLVGLPAQFAQAGPLIDWLFRPAYAPPVPVGAPYPVTAGYAPALPYNSGYTPYSTGYAPYTTGYNPYATGYAPYSTGYAPAANAYAPRTSGYNGYSGYSPYGVAYPSTGYRPTTGNLPTQSSYPLPTYGTYYGSTSPVVGANGYGYLTQRPPNDVIAPAVLPPTAPLPAAGPVTLVPDYRSNYARTPVTYYRPVLTTDPNTGAQIVTQMPCSSYEYQTQRVPTWGLTQVYNGGATLPAVTPTAPIVSPTYSLPRGGIPLSGPVPGTQPYSTAYGTYPSMGPSMATSTITPVAPTMGSIITPASPNAFGSQTPYSSGYSNYASNYGNYSALQPGAALPPTSAYQTQPYSPYYGNGATGGSTGSGSTGGGSTGNYIAPPTTYNNTPYGSAPAPTFANPQPSFAAPAPSIAPSYPGATNSLGSPPFGQQPPANNGLVFPPASPSSDPAANVTPSFPQINSGSQLNNKPQLQNIVQQPMPSTRSFNPSSPPASSHDNKPTTPVSEGLLPIPLPEEYKNEPRWNPGLLKEKDTTASVKRDIDPQVAWGSKPIRWASHKTSTGKSMPDPVVPELPPARLRNIKPEKFTPPVTEIPEVNFQPPVPARLELEEPANKTKK